MPLYDIIPAAALEQSFTYFSDEPLCAGQCVLIPLRKRITPGICLQESNVSPDALSFKVQNVSQILPWNFSNTSATFLQKFAQYNIIPIGYATKMMLPFNGEFLTKQYAKSLDGSAAKATTAKNSATPSPTDILLNAEQQEAFNTLIARQHFSVDLLDGVTGSGKTEVYLSILKQRLQENAEGMQALILLPEIALTASLVQRLERYFHVAPSVWHSGTTPVSKWKIWQKAITGEPLIVVGTRSALFIPFKNLSTIIVDEEHDASYKQNEQGAYHARDMAILRAQITDIPIVLVSATPSLSTVYNLRLQKYHRVVLSSRFAGAQIPQVTLVNMRQEEGRPILSAPLSDAITHALANHEQTLLFVNQRGYAPVSLCTACGFIWNCPSCDINLIEHQAARTLCCHHCGFTQAIANVCPECQAADTRILLGVGMERAHEAVQLQFPHARCLPVSSETIRSRKTWEQALHAIQNGDVDILLGTQILAKGHHFPNLTVVGVIEADKNMDGCDLRANEKTYQLLHQVAGRAGRAHKPGHVFLQTYNPDHPLMQALKDSDRERFYAYELEDRQNHAMPPFKTLIALILSGTNEAAVHKGAVRLARDFPAQLPASLLGPVPAPIAKLRGRYRYRLLLKIEKGKRIQPFIAEWARTKDRSVTLHIDVDPYEFL